VSGWEDLDEALDAARAAAGELARLPGAAIAAFLERYAARLVARGALAAVEIDPARKAPGAATEPADEPASTS
jgi:acyl-CoA reductase-like NAD-dependent aldehyde dehydrogenase